jgi:hypothetical protein
MRATAAEVLARVDAGQDPELDKLIRKRAEEEGVSRLEALAAMLPQGP